MLDQNKKRIFDSPKVEYTLRTINSVIKSCELAKEYFKDLKINIWATWNIPTNSFGPAFATYVVDKNKKYKFSKKTRNS